mmetsp:Transcript_18482/g.25699  ORF Transcript_18482/g.25699 Transcript_18482/m.25699 type:complete len:184 (+) Transcript_18482:248-799(+)|eukprot:CAMPEP_0184489192 /NCGR_PEP_ID=MMETSP0113_2-20130426/14730_1 /TAXON_ID=91329 /ORGANISM="Norrisiella sphaerica, Strain BC52" /LENGTH=183 /DNA_ID=CAMNT_0026872469 /DNA_START=188 /DNA_END=739 /DNA_ORIENTATION=+
MDYSSYERIADDEEDSTGKSKAWLYDSEESTRIAAAVNICILIAGLLFLVGAWQVVRARHLQATTTRELCEIIDRRGKECFYECACDGDGNCLQCTGVESKYYGSSSKCEGDVLESVYRQCYPAPRFDIGDIVQCFIPDCDEKMMYLGSPNHDYFAAVMMLAFGFLASVVACGYRYFQSHVSV